MERRIERLDRYLKSKGISGNYLETESGLSKGTLSKARSGKTDIGASNLVRVLEKFTDINETWLLKGEGPMLKERALNVYNVEQNGNADVVGEGASLDKRVTINGEPSNMRLEVERLKAEVSVLREQNDKLLELLAGRGRS